MFKRGEIVASPLSLIRMKRKWKLD